MRDQARKVKRIRDTAKPVYAESAWWRRGVPIDPDIPDFPQEVALDLYDLVSIVCRRVKMLVDRANDDLTGKLTSNHQSQSDAVLLEHKSALLPNLLRNIGLSTKSEDLIQKILEPSTYDVVIRM